jgi:DmsE family decaheme c-type cytochrome
MMKKPTAIPGMAKAFIGSFLILAYCAIHGARAENAASSPPPNVTPSAETDTSGPASTGAKGKAPQQAPTPGPKENESAVGAGDENQPQYVGADTCISCHQDNGNSLLHSVHGRLMESRKGIPFDKACETCHGPGSLHVEFADNTTDARFHTIKFPPKLPAPEANAICLSCHENKAHFHWKGSPHDMKNVTCISCHMIHQDEKKPNAHLLKTARLMDTCFTCHIEKKAQVSRNAHMPLNEDDMSCTSCHDMHGTSGEKNLLGDSVNETCYKCHADKRGPFLFEHPPTRESCLNCHNPHGSMHDFMLVENPPYLCQRCHSGTRHPSTAYDSHELGLNALQQIGSGCLNCHSNIHGSNSPSGVYFQR